MTFKKYLSATSIAIVAATLSMTNIFADQEVIATGENTAEIFVYSEDGKNLGSIQKGSWFNIHELKNGYGKISGIQHQGVFSEIKDGWISLIDVETIFIEKEILIGTGETNSDTKLFDENGNVIGTVKNGSWFNIYKDEGNRIKVSGIQHNGVYSDIQEGWLNITDVTTIYIDGANEKVISTGETLKDTIVYNEHGYEIGVIKKGTCFNIYKINNGSPNNLYKIKQIQSSNIREGWVKDTNIKVTNLDGTIIMPDKDLIENKDIEKEGGNGLEDDPAIVKINTVDGLKCLGNNVVKIKPTKEVDNLFVYQLKITNGDVEFFINVKVEKTNIDVIEQLEKIEDDFIPTKPVTPNNDIELVGGEGLENDPLVVKVGTVNGLNSLISGKEVVRIAEVKEIEDLFVYSLRISKDDKDLFVSIKVEKNNSDVISALNSITEELPPVVDPEPPTDNVDPQPPTDNEGEGEGEGEGETDEEDKEEPEIPVKDVVNESGTGSPENPVVLKVNTLKGLESVLDEIKDKSTAYSRLGDPITIDENTIMYKLYIISAKTGSYVDIKVDSSNQQAITMLDSIHKMYIEDTESDPVIPEYGVGTETDPYVAFLVREEGLDIVLSDLQKAGFTDVKTVGEPNITEDEYLADTTYHEYTLRVEKDGEFIYIKLRTNSYNTNIVERLELMENISK